MQVTPLPHELQFSNCCLTLYTYVMLITCRGK